MVTSVNNNSALAAANASKPYSPNALPDAGEINDRFISLLVAQLQNQDPLSPMDNTEVTSQMAQLNTVSGIQNLNKTVEGLGEIISAGQFSQALGLLDRQVLVQGNDLAYNGGPVQGQFKAEGNTQNVVATIVNGLGQPVREIQIGDAKRGLNEFTWDGRNADGTLLPAGNYTAQVTGVRGGEEVSLQTLAYDTVNSVDNTGNGGFTVSTASGRTLAPTDIVKVF